MLRRFLAIAGPNFKTQRRINSLPTSESSFGQQILDGPIAQGEPKIEPDGMADDVRREAVTGVRDGFHRPGFESWLRLFEQRPAEVKWIPAGLC